MLPAPMRIRRGADYALTVRAGRRAGTSSLVVHLLRTPSDRPARAGVIVSRAVGGAVTRNRLRRQLQHLLVDRLAHVGPGTDLVVRVNPAAAGRSWHDLTRDLDAGLARVTHLDGRSGAP